MNKIVRAGIAEEMPEYLKDRVLITNQVALLMAFVSVCYVVFSLIFYPQLMI